jgi:hypothetical protein
MRSFMELYSRRLDTDEHKQCADRMRVARAMPDMLPILSYPEAAV